MNKHLLTLTAFTLTLTLLSGCDKDTDATTTSVTDTDVVTFTATAEDTRGASVPAGALNQSETFRVFATKKDEAGQLSAFIPDDGTQNIVTYGTVKPDAPYYDNFYGLQAWHTTGGYTWTGEYTYNFYAVWPATAPQMTPSDDLQTVTIPYTIPANADEDLLYAITTDAKRNVNGTPLTFRHALAQVAFKGQTSSEFNDKGWQVDVSRVTLHNVYGSGNLQFHDGTFASPANLRSCSFIMMPDEDKTYTAMTTTARLLTSATDMPMLMPQQNAAWQPETECITATADKTLTTGSYLTVTYHMYDTATQADLIGTASNFEIAYVPIPINWEGGKRYIYTITFGVGYNAAGERTNAPITVSASIYPWQETDAELEAN